MRTGENAAVLGEMADPFGNVAFVRWWACGLHTRCSRSGHRWMCERHGGGRSRDGRLGTRTQQRCVTYALEFGDQLRELVVSYALHGDGLLLGWLMRVGCCDAGLHLRVLLLQRGGGRGLEQLMVRHA